MQQYLRIRHVVLLLVMLAVMGGSLLSAQEDRPQSVKILYTGKYFPLKCRVDKAMMGELALDPQLRYVAHDDNRRVQIWTLSTNLTSSELAYEGPIRDDREVVGAAMTKGGLAFIVDLRYPKGEASYQLFMWDPVIREARRLKWGDEFRNILSYSDGTELAHFRSELNRGGSKYVFLVELFDLSGRLLKTIKLNVRPDGFHSPVTLDKFNNVYIVDQNREQTRRAIGVILAERQSYEVVGGGGELLIENVQSTSEPEKPAPLLLEDGLTLAAYVRGTKGSKCFAIQYYREGKLVKSANDPVPQGNDEARLVITGDGKGVVTQVLGGEMKGLVRVWDIEMGKSSDITNAPPITHVFPWVQGKCAPVWTSSDGQTYEGGLLEIARRHSD